MNLTCFYCQTPFTLSMDQKIAALRKMHAENLHHYDAHCPRCGRANAISRERLEMFTPGWEEAIKEPVAAVAAVVPAGMDQPNTQMPSPVKEPSAMPAERLRRGPARKRHAPAAKKAVKKPAAKKATAKKTAKKATKKAATKKKTATKSKKTARKTAKKSR